MNKLLIAIILICPFYTVWANTESPGTGELRLENAQEQGKQISAILLDSNIDVSVTAMTARVTLIQTFRNQSSTWVNARYLFPLPEDAAVNAMQLSIGERTINGVIKEKQEAIKVYENAKKEGKHAALLQSHRPNMFSMNAANIPPGAEIKTRLVYLQTIRYENEQFSLTIPTTFTPRYIPGKALNDAKTNELQTDLGWSKPTNQVIDAQLITPPQSHPDPSVNDHRIGINVTINSGIQIEAIDSPLHELQWVENNGLTFVSLKDNQNLMNRDFSISWKPVAYDIPQAAVFREDQDGDAYTTLMLVPPQEQTTLRLPREVIFILDTSGSMGGVSIRQARQSLKIALGKLSAVDYFNIIEFDDDTHSLYPESVSASRSHLNEAAQFITRLDADGGTEMMPALLTAFSQPGIENHLRQIIFITDGSVGNENALFEIISDNLGDARLFTVAIGSAPNTFFMRKAAHFGRGTTTNISDQSEVMDKISTLFTHLENPVLRDIQIQWPSKNSDHASDQTSNQLNNHVDQYPNRIPDLYLGEPLVVYAKTDQTSGQIKITGKLNNTDWFRELSFPNKVNSSGQATIWARKKIENLMDSMITGVPEETIKSEVVSLGIEHKLVSRYTSFVAIEDKTVRPESESTGDQRVSNLLPHGSNMGSTVDISFPGTSTSAALNLTLGLLFLLISTLFYYSGIRNED